MLSALKFPKNVMILVHSLEKMITYELKCIFKSILMTYVGTVAPLIRPHRSSHSLLEKKKKNFYSLITPFAARPETVRVTLPYTLLSPSPYRGSSLTFLFAAN